MTADRFPEGIGKKADIRCGTWSGATVDGTFCAWQDKGTVLRPGPK
ncbi:hypothetical protein [Streptomyces pinistramenti]|nr:hypothetical protein [Streptomyces pinistramenti]MCB5911243.1 hypothetical protein [Streptomyces pinistramenti]